MYAIILKKGLNLDKIVVYYVFMNEEYELLMEKEEIWANMFIQILKENNIDFIVKRVNGIAISMKTGSQDYLRIYVKKSEKNEVEKLIKSYK